MSKIGKRHSESSEEEGEVPDGDSGAGEGNQGNRPSQERNGKKTADALIDELFSDLRRSENPVDVSEAITEDKRVVSEARASRRASERDSGRDADRSRDHKHSKKSKKEKKHKKRSSHRSRSRSRDRKRKRRGSSSDSNAPAKTGTLGEILIKTKNLDDLHKKKAEEKEKKAEHKSSDEDDELPVGADYRTVMSESIAASSSAAASNNGEPAPVLPGSDLPPVKRTAFPLSKSDGEKKEPEDKKSDMLQKVISDKGGASLVPRKLQLDKEPKKDNGTKEETFGPAPPPAAKADAGGDEEEETELMLSKAPPPTKTAAKIAFGQITLKVDPPVEKKEEKAATSTAGPNDSKAGEGGSSSGESSADETAKDDAPAAKLKKEDDAKAKEATVDKKDDKFPERDKDKKSKLSVRKRTESSTDADRKAKKAKEDRDKKKDRKRSRSPERSRDKHSRSRDRRDRSRRSRSRSRDRRGGDRDGRRRRSRSRSGDRRRRSISRERSRLAMRTMRRSRTRSRSRSREKIDKAKLLEVALQNVRGAGGPVGKELSEKMNIKVLEKAGGRNINDIVSYCQKISEEEKAEYERGDGGSDGEGSGRSSLKKKTEIRMNIKDAKQLPTRTPQERLLDAEPLNGVFPVSSGTIHRDSEWKKVDPNASVVPSVCRTVEQKKFVAASSMAKTEAARMGVALPPNPFPILPPPPVPPNLVRGDLIPPPPIPPLFPDYKNFMPPPPMPPVIVTPSADRLLDVGDSSYDEGRRGLRRKMDARGECVERLKKDPNDYDAMKTLRQIDDALKDFADNQELSGRWQGHTRVSNLLSAEELQPHDPRYHAWTRKDLFKHTQPLVSGVGMKLLQKMGWRPGQGLGAQKQGDTLPLALDVKSDRKGLYSEGNDIPISKSKNKGSKGAGRGGGGGGGGGGAGAASLEPKNPISALMELCQRKKWPLPEFIFHEEGGNFSSKKFTCIVKLGGQTFYGPECAQKKAAKTEGAKTALEKIGFAAPNVQTPMIYDPSSQYSMPEQILQARVRQVMGGGREYEMVPPPNPTALAPQPYGVLAPGPKPLVGLPRTMGAVHGAMPGGAPQANNTDSLLMPPPPPPPPAPVKEPPKAVPAPPPPKAPEPVKPPPKAAPVMGGGTGRPPPHHGGPGPMGGAPLAPIGSGWMPDDDGDFTADVAPPRPRPPPSAYSSFPARHEEPRFAPHHAHPMGHHGGSYGRPPRSHSPAYERPGLNRSFSGYCQKISEEEKAEYERGDGVSESKRQPLVSGVGMKLLQKMGWRPGQGLGAQKQGDTLPLALDLKNFPDNQELSGRWQGHTRVSNLLSAEELQPHDPRYHSWTRKDLFKHTQPLVSGVGMKLLQKMGWRPGQGLGAQKQGDTLPLALDVKSDRKGLYSEGNDIPISKSKNKGSKGAGRGGGGGGGWGGSGSALSEPKNPISALMELCQRKKWPLPEFIFHEEGGNFSSKKFTCIVKLGGQTFYGPECAQKKAAKTEGAKTALEKIGFAAPNVQTPMIYDPSSQYSMPEQILQARVRQVMGGGREYEMVPPPNPVALAPQPYGVLAPGPKPLVGLPRTMGAVHGAMPGGPPQANNTDSLLMPPPPPPPPAPVKEPPKAVPAPPPTKAPEPVKPPPKAAPVMGGGTGRPPPHHGGPGPMEGAPLAPIGSGWMPDDDGDFTADVAPPRPRPPPSAYSSFPARHEEPRFAPHHAHPMGHHGGSYGRPPRSHSPAYERVRYF